MDLAPILIAEDEPLLRELLVEALRTQGHAVIAVSDGKAALDRLLEAPVGLLITDLQLPVLDGLALMRQFKEHSQRAHTPIIAISARPRLLNVVVTEQLAERTLCKPFTFHALRAEVNTLLG